MTRTYAFTVDVGRVRLDRFLGEALREQDVSREKVKRAIRDGGCLVDRAVCTDVSAKVGAGQSIELRTAAEPQPEPSGQRANDHRGQSDRHTAGAAPATLPDPAHTAGLPPRPRSTSGRPPPPASA